jgi:hypothetical protein
MRLKVLHRHLSSTKEKEDIKKMEPTLNHDEVLRPIKQCFNKVEVSSNRNEASKLTDGDVSTYWQSDGAARSHWIRLSVAANVVIKQLQIHVLPSDQSYMPHHVVVLGGRDENSLREINEVRIPITHSGDFLVLDNLKTHYPVIQLAIRRCHSDGCDSRVRQIKAIGYRVVKSRGASVMDATAMWYLSIISSTAQAALPIAPQLRATLIQHSKDALAHMAPLCLSTTSSERPAFLSLNIVEQMETFIRDIVCIPDTTPSSEELFVLLRFSIARGSLGALLDTLRIVIKHPNTTHQVTKFIRQIQSYRDEAIRKHGRQQSSLCILSCDGGEKEISSSPGNILDSDNNKVYMTETGKKKVIFMLYTVIQVFDFCMVE